MTYEEAISISNELKAHLNGAFSVREKERIHELYSAVLRKELKVTTCQRCYHDALIEVILYLRNEGKMKEETQYALRAGFIIHSANFRNGKIFTNNNLTDEVAEEYLAMFPHKKTMFAKIPEPKEDLNQAPVAEEPKKVYKSKRKKK